MRILGAVAGLLLATSAALEAQEATGPRAGAWAAEGSFTPTAPDVGGLLLRFRNDRSAWLFGLDVSASEREPVLSFEGGQVVMDDVRTVIVGARFGLRSLRSPGVPVRPLVGAGILGTISQITGRQHSWSAGAYGEVGISRFFGPSFSVGAISELQARRFEQRAGELRPTEFRIDFEIVRFTATVIF